MYKCIVYIGRFQPFHLGHQYVVKEALKRGDKLLILLGSANKPRSDKNPWTLSEREEMIRASFSPEDNARIILKPLNDENDDATWVRNVQAAVSGIAKEGIALIGHEKDDSSYYLGLFPAWKFIGLEHYKGINGCDIRKMLLSENGLENAKQLIPIEVYKFLQGFNYQAL